MLLTEAPEGGWAWRAVAELVDRLGGRYGFGGRLGGWRWLAGSAGQGGEGLAGEVAGAEGFEQQA